MFSSVFLLTIFLIIANLGIVLTKVTNLITVLSAILLNINSLIIVLSINLIRSACFAKINLKKLILLYSFF